MTSIATPAHSSKSHQWYRPTVSPEHGVYVVLLVSFLTGSAAAQQWTWVTFLALICGFLAFQAEHPLVWQVKQRKSIRPRLLFWASFYGGIAGAIALWLMWHNSDRFPLLLIYSMALIALSFDVISVWHRQQKSRLNELVTFAAVCLLAPLAYTVTTDTISKVAIALWALNTLFFSSAIFTVKLRKTKTASVIPSIIFHGIASAIVVALGLAGWLSWWTASAFGVVLLKFILILWRKNWYCTAKIQTVAFLETVSSLTFLIIAAISLLPHYLP